MAKKASDKVASTKAAKARAIVEDLHEMDDQVFEESAAPKDPVPEEVHPMEKEALAKLVYVSRCERTAQILERLFSNDEDPISIRQLSLATGCSYNVLLKASKAPIVGQMYDPDAVNYNAMAGCVVRKLGDKVETFEWDDVRAIGPTANGGSAITADLHVGDVIKLRDVAVKDESGNTVSVEQPMYNVHIVTPTHIVIMEAEGTKPRVMSLSTYVHCGGKVINRSEKEATSESSD